MELSRQDAEPACQQSKRAISALHQIIKSLGQMLLAGPDHEFVRLPLNIIMILPTPKLDSVRLPPKRATLLRRQNLDSVRLPPKNARA